MMARTERRRCTACSHEYDVLHDMRPQYRGLPPTSLDNEDMDDVSCPKCHAAEFDKILAGGTGIQLGGDAGAGRHFPYWDPSLMCNVRSAQHRRWLMTHHPNGELREVKLRPTEGAFDPAAEGQKLFDERARAVERAKEDQRRQDADPEIRRAKDIIAQIKRDGRLDELVRQGRLQ